MEFLWWKAAVMVHSLLNRLKFGQVLRRATKNVCAHTLLSRVYALVFWGFFNFYFGTYIMFYVFSHLFLSPLLQQVQLCTYACCHIAKLFPSYHNTVLIIETHDNAHLRSLPDSATSIYLQNIARNSKSEPHVFYNKHANCVSQTWNSTEFVCLKCMVILFFSFWVRKGTKTDCSLQLRRKKHQEKFASTVNYEPTKLPTSL